MNFDKLFNQLNNVKEELKPVLNNQDNFCCGKEMVLIPAESFIVCKLCGNSRWELTIINDRDCNYPTKTYYKRMTHFKNTIKCLEGIDRNTIPTEVIDIIKNIGFESLEELKLLMINNNLTIYIKSIFKIYRIIKGTYLISFNNLVRTKLIGMFSLVSNNYSSTKNKNNKNLLKYHFIIKKLLELIGCEEPIKYLNIYKTDKKIDKCNRVWKEICDINKWGYREERYEYYINNYIKCISCKITYPTDNIHFYYLNKANNSLMKKCSRCYIQPNILTKIDKIYMKKKLLVKLNVSLLKKRLSLKELDTFERKLFNYDIDYNKEMIREYREYSMKLSL